MYYVAQNSVSDASGGSNVNQIAFDPRYVSLVAAVQVLVSSAAADVNIDCQINADATMNEGYRAVASLLPVSGVDFVRHYWTPPPVFCVSDDSDSTTAPFIKVRCDNTDTETLAVYAKVFNFDRQALNNVPIEVLSSVLTRASALV